MPICNTHRNMKFINLLHMQIMLTKNDSCMLDLFSVFYEAIYVLVSLSIYDICINLY